MRWEKSKCLAAKRGLQGRADKLLLLCVGVFVFSLFNQLKTVIVGEFKDLAQQMFVKSLLNKAIHFNLLDLNFALFVALKMRINP